jgi:hypothetical protein
MIGGEQFYTYNNSSSRHFLFVTFSFVDNVDKFTAGDKPDASILLAWPCEKIGREAEKLDPEGIGSPSDRFFPSLVHRASPEDRTLSRMRLRMYKGGQVSTNKKECIR